MIIHLMGYYLIQQGHSNSAVIRVLHHKPPDYGFESDSCLYFWDLFPFVDAP